MQIDLQQIHVLFKEYVHTFYSTNADIQKHILLKEEHTEKVMKYCVELAKNLRLNQRQQQIAELIGLFHDLGRFKQYNLYRTFNDHLSENHAELGLKEIAKLNIRKFMTPEEWREFCFAIKYHNAIAIPQTANRKQYLFATIIRDADKLDIYRVLAPFLTPPSPEGYSKVLIDDLLLGRQSKFTNLKTPDDYKLVRLCWIYDINYSWTLGKIVEQQYIEQIFQYLPFTQDIQQVKTKLNHYITAKIAG